MLLLLLGAAAVEVRPGVFLVAAGSFVIKITLQLLPVQATPL